MTKMLKGIHAAPADFGSASVGIFSQGRKMFGQLAAPIIPGRPKGKGGITPALRGLFRRGAPVGISQINTIATQIWRG